MTPDRLEQADELLHRLRSTGLQIEARGEDLAIRPADLLTREMATEIRDLKPEIRGLLTGDLLKHVDVDETETYWAILHEADRQYLTGPRDWPTSPCPWCRRWLGHADGCLAAEPPVVPFGKHKGQPVDQISETYVLWLRESGAGDAQWRMELDRWLATREKPNPFLPPPAAPTSKHPERRGVATSQLHLECLPRTHGHVDPSG